MLKAMLLLAAWCFLSALLAPIVGRFCALGSETDPVRERLGEVERDRRADEIVDPLFVG